MHSVRAYVEAGDGLMSYGPNQRRRFMSTRPSVVVNPLSVSAAQSMSASLRKRPKYCVAAKRRYVPGAEIPAGQAARAGTRLMHPVREMQLIGDAPVAQ